MNKSHSQIREHEAPASDQGSNTGESLFNRHNSTDRSLAHRAPNKSYPLDSGNYFFVTVNVPLEQILLMMVGAIIACSEFFLLGKNPLQEYFIDNK
jgi:hypothetical protein